MTSLLDPCNGLDVEEVTSLQPDVCNIKEEFLKESYEKVQKKIQWKVQLKPSCKAFVSEEVLFIQTKGLFFQELYPTREDFLGDLGICEDIILIRMLSTENHVSFTEVEVMFCISLFILTDGLACCLAVVNRSFQTAHLKNDFTDEEDM